MEYTHLVEPGIKYFINATLKKCHETKEYYYSIYYNIGLFIVLAITIVFLLSYMYKGKLTPVEKQIKKQKERNYILQKINKFQDIKREQKQELITNLPKWNSGIDTPNKNVYR